MKWPWNFCSDMPSFEPLLLQRKEEALKIFVSFTCATWQFHSSHPPSIFLLCHWPVDPQVMALLYPPPFSCYASDPIMALPSPTFPLLAIPLTSGNTCNGTGSRTHKLRKHLNLTVVFPWWLREGGGSYIKAAKRVLSASKRLATQLNSLWSQFF